MDKFLRLELFNEFIHIDDIFEPFQPQEQIGLSENSSSSEVRNNATSSYSSSLTTFTALPEYGPSNKPRNVAEEVRKSANVVATDDKIYPSTSSNKMPSTSHYGQLNLALLGKETGNASTQKHLKLPQKHKLGKKVSEPFKVELMDSKLREYLKRANLQSKMCQVKKRRMDEGSTTLPVKIWRRSKN